MKVKSEEEGKESGKITFNMEGCIRCGGVKNDLCSHAFVIIEGWEALVDRDNMIHGRGCRIICWVYTSNSNKTRLCIWGVWI